ncbi:hypothetical protein ARMGADRAFT_1084342 [Armillaria gallica]|uniref:Uncharacterized protein n=1 Tax=Armillaria gallica TaxID=47427 RepID=A0A2H3D3W1_ARMGA|nr:hypothetical protein ARMGADRAFT_1084342 [Armillaria gallica]
MNSEANHIAPTTSALVKGTDRVRESALSDTVIPGGESGGYARGYETQEEETLESQLEEINAPGDHGLCMYISEQVTWLRYLMPRFQEAL